jgi:ParB family chromosome partitioning protein
MTRRAAPRSIDFAASMAKLSTTAEAAASERLAPSAKWAKGREVTEQQPSAVASDNPPRTEPRIGRPLVPTALNQPAMFDVSQCVVGNTYDVPIHLIDPNPLGARYFYRAENIEMVGKTMSKDGQDVPANGYVHGDRVVLYDGGTRLRSATQFGIAKLQVKIETPPADRKELYKRSARLNDQRSDHTALDVAVSMARLMKEGIYETQDQIAADILDRKGNALSKAQVSMYLRIARIPEPFLAKMSYHDQTSSFTIAYEISSIFALADYDKKPDEYNDVASAVIDEIQKRQLSKSQAQALIQSKLEGKQSRQRADSTTVRLGECKGLIKVFPSRGQLDFTIKGLDPQTLDQLKDSIEKVCSGQLPLAG